MNWLHAVKSTKIRLKLTVWFVVLDLSVIFLQNVFHCLSGPYFSRRRLCASKLSTNSENLYVFVNVT